jgi:hypothetical protein
MSDPNPVRPVRRVSIAESIWSAFEQMSTEMGTDRDGLINQAMYMFARLNGFLVPSPMGERVASGANGASEEPSPPQPRASARTVTPPIREPDLVDDPEPEPEPEPEVEAEADDQLEQEIEDEPADKTPLPAPPPPPPPPRRSSPPVVGPPSRPGARETAAPPPPPAEPPGRRQDGDGEVRRRGGDGPPPPTQFELPANRLDDDPERKEVASRVLETAAELERMIRGKQQQAAEPPRPDPTNVGASHAAAGEKALYLMGDDGELEKVVKDRFVIGRGKHCDLCINSGKVSREHAAISKEASAEYYIEDLGSSNGTWFNKQRIKRRKIEDGDEYFICSDKIKCVIR